MESPDTIELRGLRLTGLVGVLPEERVRPQPLEIDLDVMVDLSRAGESDSLDHTVDYGALCELVAEVVANGSPRLLERLASELAEAVLTGDARIDQVVVVVRKLRPPVPQDLATSGVRLCRRRGAMPLGGDGR